MKALPVKLKKSPTQPKRNSFGAGRGGRLMKEDIYAVMTDL